MLLVKAPVALTGPSVVLLSAVVGLADVLRQPQLAIQDLVPLWPDLARFPHDVLLEAESLAKYDGYLKRQTELAEKLSRLEFLELPSDIMYEEVAGLSREVIEKLRGARPATLGQASRISGVTPASLACLEIHLKKTGRIYSTDPT